MSDCPDAAEHRTRRRHLQWASVLVIMVAALTALPPTVVTGARSGPAGATTVPPPPVAATGAIDPCAGSTSCSVLGPGLGSFPSLTQSAELLNRTVGWTQVASPPSSLGVGGEMIADTQTGKAIVFGGESAGHLVNTTFVYTEATNHWANISSASAPPPRSDFAFALDPATQIAVVFGGITNVTTLSVSNETWAYDVATRQWTSETRPIAPPARQAAAFAIDPLLGVGFLFGGWNQSYGSSESITYSDLWELNLSSFTWSQVNETGSSPRPLEGATMAWDSTAGTFQMFGGCYPCTANVWSLDPTTLAWTLDPTSGPAPAPRASGSWAYDPGAGGGPSGGAEMLFGGTNGASDFKDTYLFYPESGAWAAQVLPPDPGARFDAASGFLNVPGNATFLVAGGSTESPAAPDLWRLSATSDVSLYVANASAPTISLPGAAVNLSGVRAGVTDLSGYLNLTQVNAEGTTLNVTDAFYSPWQATIWLPSGQTTNLTVDLVPEPPGSVEVTVVTLRNAAIPSVLVNLSVSGLRFYHGLTDGSGTVSFNSVVPGRIVITAALAGWRTNQTNETLAPSGLVATTLVLVPDPILTVSILGQFPGPLLLPLSGVAVDVNGTGFGVSNGRGVVVGVTTCFGRVYVSSEPTGYEYNYTVATIPWTGVVQVSLVVPSLPFGRIEVTVLRLGDGSPIGGASVNASVARLLPSGDFNETNTTDSGGVGSLSVPQGDFYVGARAAGYYPAALQEASVLAGLSQDLTFYLRQLPLANVRFVIRDAGTGAPIVGANVTDRPAVNGFTDYAGVYNATNLTPGAYVFTADAPGYYPNGSSLTLIYGENITDEINLTRAPPNPTPNSPSFTLYSAGGVDAWAFVLIPILLTVGGFVYASATRWGRRDDPPRRTSTPATSADSGVAPPPQ